MDVATGFSSLLHLLSKNNLMKQFSTGLCIVLLMLFTINSIAQKTSSKKPFLFNDYPAVIDCTETQLNSLFIAGNDMNVSLSLPGNLTLKGEVTNRATK